MPHKLDLHELFESEEGQGLADRANLKSLSNRWGVSVRVHNFMRYLTNQSGLERLPSVLRRKYRKIPQGEVMDDLMEIIKIKYSEFLSQLPK